jgi:TRAP-type mannitol/chloroaromatic compound transport system substrate-binding protein
MSTQKLSGKRILLTAVVLAVAVALAAPAWAQQAPIKWKAQTLWNAQERPQKTFEDFCKRVKVLTNGRLEIEPYPAGAIVPTNETLTALQSNVLQAIHVWPGYASGRNPAFAALCDFIFAYESPWELDVFMHYKGGLELLRELYKPFGAYTVGVMSWGVESWPSKKPIRNMDDFKGLKIREPQGMEAEFMAKAGASVVSLPGTEIFSALDKGVVDATNWATASINNQTGFHQVAPYFTYPGFHSMPVGDFTVRQADWDKLPADIKEILVSACREWAWDTIEKVAMDDVKLVSEAKSKGLTPIAWAPEDRAKARKIAQEIWQGWKGKNEQTKRAIELHEAWLRELGRIQ